MSLTFKDRTNRGQKADNSKKNIEKCRITNSKVVANKDCLKMESLC
jgi:hypothetical protein